MRNLINESTSVAAEIFALSKLNQIIVTTVESHKTLGISQHNELYTIFILHLYIIV